MERAWMSLRDQQIVDNLLRHQAERRRGAPLRVLEWGAGLSTYCLPRDLVRDGYAVSWLALEHDADYASLLCLDVEPGERAEAWAERPGVQLVAWRYGRLQPWHRVADRGTDLAPYVAFAARTGRQWDLVLVDGRHRRRCLLEAAHQLAAGGVVVLHDAHRPYYHCAFAAYAAHALVGDDLWLGVQAADELDALQALAEAPPQNAAAIR